MKLHSRTFLLLNQSAKKFYLNFFKEHLRQVKVIQIGIAFFFTLPSMDGLSTRFSDGRPPDHYLARKREAALSRKWLNA